MWLFAHVGLTIGCATLVDDFPGRSRGRRLRGAHGPDYRLLAIGASAPDLDKLIGLASGHGFERGYLHTALCALILSGVGVYWWRRTGGTGPLQVAGCWLLHLALDGMWATPGVLLWPAPGWRMPGGDMGWADFVAYMVRSLSRDPKQYVPEMVGAGIVLGLYWVMQRRRAALLRRSD